MINGADTPKPILVLDFDGTLCIGDAPVWAYANAIVETIGHQSGAAHHQLHDDIRRQLEAFLDGEPNSQTFSDGYDAVAQLTAPYATPQQLQAAYATSRRELARGALDVHAPAGLKGLLSELHPTTTIVLITNAPQPGIAETVETLGLAAEIDRVITDADKPSGWESIIPELLATGPAGNRQAETVMVVGDIWSNDIAVPLRLGCATAYIDRFGQRAGVANLVASDFPSLYDGIREWAGNPLVFSAAHPPHLGSPAPTHESPTHRTGTQ